MKKRLSHFAYNERSRSGWTLSSPRFTSLSPLRSTIKELLPMSPARLLLLSLVRTKGDQGGFQCYFSRCHRLHFLKRTLVPGHQPVAEKTLSESFDRPRTKLSGESPCLRITRNCTLA